MTLVDLKTLAVKTALSVFTLRKLIKKGMPHYRVERKILINPQEFEDWFQRFKAGSIQVPDNIGNLVDKSIEKIK
jgi:hypothetical protein